jgi:hypothetical protein
MKALRWISAPAAALALVAAVAGCGGASAHLSNASYITRADAICLKASKAQDALSKPSSAAEMTAYVRHVYAIERGVVADVRALTPPDGDASTVRSMLDNVDKALAFESDVEAAAATGNQSQINDAEAKGARFLNSANTKASKYGFKECGNS